MSDGLKNGEPAPLPLQAVRTYWAQQTHQAATPADVQPSTNLKRDLDSLTTAYTFYMAPMAPVSFMTVGFGLLLGGLLLIGWRLHLVIFLVLLVPLAYYAYMLTMRNR